MIPSGASSNGSKNMGAKMIMRRSKGNSFFPYRSLRECVVESNKSISNYLELENVYSFRGF